MSTLTTTRVAGAMHALVFREPGRRFEHIAVPEIALHEGEVLVGVDLATICGSDLHTISGARHVEAPLVLGHEQVGRVVALGPGDPATTVEGTPLAVGDRVVWAVAVPCGECRFCELGIPQKCVTLRKYGHERMQRGWELGGGFASHVHLLPGTPIVSVDTATPATVLAPASCATATVFAALAAARAIRPLAGAVVAVSGCGMLGLTAIAAATAAGATVVASEPDPERRALAETFGATAVCDGSAAGWRAALGRHGYGVALELSGDPRAVQDLLGVADTAAALILVGSVFPTPAVALDPEKVVRGMLTVRGVHNYAPEHLVEAVRFLATADHRAFSGLVSMPHPLGSIHDAVALAETRTNVRVALAPEAARAAVVE